MASIFGGIRGAHARRALVVVLALVAGGFFAATARADNARFEVATVDGQPVYQWRTFKSAVSDDVERALVIGEFQRKKFQIPQKLVDEAMQREIAKNFGGNADKFSRYLREKGVSAEDFREFTREEIILGAMLYQNGGNSADRARKQSEWLARLREGKTVTPVSVRPPTAEDR